MSKIFDRTARIAVIDPNVRLRKTIGNLLESVQLYKIDEYESITKFIIDTGSKSFDWIITSLYKDDATTGIALLKHIIDTPSLRGMRVSFLLSDEEINCLSLAFELGLLFWIQNDLKNPNFGSEITKYIDRLKENSGNECITTAEIVNDFLVSQKRYADAASFNENVLEIFPGEATVLLKLSVALHRSGEIEKAITLLQQVAVINSNLALKVEQISKKLFPERKLQELNQEYCVNTLGIKSCVIIDGDEIQAGTLKEKLVEAGTSEVKLLTSIDSNLTNLVDDESKLPDVILSEWKLRNYTGCAFIQSVRKKYGDKIPIILISSLVQERDVPLLHEMGVANIIRKPVMLDNFFTRLSWTLQQERNPTQPQTLEWKISWKLKTGDRSGAEALKMKLFSKPMLSDGIKNHIKAEFAYFDEQYREASTLAVECLKLKHEMVVVLNLLGQCLVQLRDFENANKCFEKANSLAPMNLERLCEMAEVNAELRNDLVTQELLDKADSIDAKFPRLQETKINCAFILGNFEKSRDMLSKLGSINTVIRSLNNRAVAMARTGAVEQSLEVYENLLKVIPITEKRIMRIVTYNLCLALARSKNLKRSLEVLGYIKGDETMSIVKKARSLQAKVQHALTTGEELKFDEASHGDNFDSLQGISLSDEIPLDTGKSMSSSIELPISKGEVGCHLLYKSSVPHDPQTLKLLEEHA